MARSTLTPARASVLAAALDALTVHVAIIDDDARIVAVNGAWRDFAAGNGAAGVTWEGQDYLHGSQGAGAEDGASSAAGIAAVLAGRAPEFRAEYPCHSPDQLRWFEVRAAPIREADFTGAVVLHAPITERRLAEQRLSFLAHHDELTGLPNRRRLLETMLDRQPSGRLGLLLLDLDHFKTVNDTYGHAAGNDVLCAVADALSRPLAGGSVAGRHGGDEFCVAVLDCDEQTLAEAARAARGRVGTHLRRLPTAQGTAVSLGATMVGPDEPLGRALERADQALYRVKDGGRDGYALG